MGVTFLNRLDGVVENDTTPFNVGVIGNPAPTAGNDQDLLTEYVYNISGSRVDITNANGKRVTATVYDSLERPIEVEDPLANAESMTYDALGNIRSTTDRNGESVTYSYDDLNRLVSTVYQTDSITVTYTYDAVGNRKTMTDDVGTTTYTHDTLYRITNVNDVFGKNVGYEYDLRGNRTKLIYPDDREVVYTYDGDGRLTEVTDWNSVDTTYTYDAANRIVSATLPNTLTVTYLYDAANRLERLTYRDSNSDLIADFDYLLDDVGNRIGVTETLAQPVTANQVTAYLETSGELVLEAENGTKEAGTEHTWTDQTVYSDYAGSGYARALPDTGEQLGPVMLKQPL